MSKKAFIQTYGCQMNEHDTQRMRAMLESLGYASTEVREDADVILVNTCSVRANPENKVYSFLGTLRPLRERNPALIVGVAGCVAQQAGMALLEREPLVSFVFGPDNLFELPMLIGRAVRGERVCSTGWQPRKDDGVVEFVPDQWIEHGHVEGVKAYIAITKGCDNHCSFCIVPKTRGREVSRPPESILREARALVDAGACELWLLGQNVNSYHAGDWRFLELLDAVSRLSGLKRLRFTSPHPRDWNNDLSDLLAERHTLCKQLHLPFQAGSDAVLRAMRRRHTIAEYLEKVAYLRQRAPQVEISADLIVGFPGETDTDFEGTLEVIETVRFSQVFPFKYSSRPGTAAARLEDDVPREVKEARLARVIAAQERINGEQQRALVGTEQVALVEEINPRDSARVNGRTDGYRPITLPGRGCAPGDLVRVRVTGFRGHWLEGEALETTQEG